MKWLKLLGQNGEKLLLGTVASIALAGSVLAIAAEGWGISHYIKDHLPAVILILLATYILFFLLGYERRIQEMKSTVDDCKVLVEQSRAGIAEHIRKWEGLGITEIYLGRHDYRQKQQYDALLKNASHDLFIVGVTLRDLTREERPLLHEKAITGCSVRLLMLTPTRWMNQQPVLDPVEPADLKAHFTDSLRNIRKLASAVAKKNENVKSRGRGTTWGLRPVKKLGGYALEVRFYDQSPALSLVAADADMESGRMRVEFTPHNEVDKGEYFRPMMDLIPKGDGLFRQFCMHYSGLWEKSQAYICVSGSKIYRNSTLDDEVSDLLGLEKKWVPDESLGHELTDDNKVRIAKS